LDIEIKLSEFINSLYKESKSQYESYSQKISEYFKELNKYKISDNSISRPVRSRFLNLLFLIFGFPFKLLGYYGNYPPLMISRNIVKNKIRSNVFIASVKIGSGVLLYLIYFLILLIPCLIFLNFYGLLLALLFPASFYLYVFYKEIYHKYKSNSCLIKLNKANPSKIDELKRIRNEIISFASI